MLPSSAIREQPSYTPAPPVAVEPLVRKNPLELPKIIEALIGLAPRAAPVPLLERAMLDEGRLLQLAV